MKKLEKTYILLVRKAQMHYAHNELGLSKTQIAKVFNVDKSTAGRVIDSKEEVKLRDLKAMGKLI